MLILPGRLQSESPGSQFDLRFLWDRWRGSLGARLDVRSLHHRPSSDHSITQFTRICFSRTNQIKFRIWGSTNFSDLENALRSTSAESGWYDRSEGRREHEITLALEHEALVCIRTDHHPNVSTHFWFHWNLFAGTQMAQQRERDRRTTAANGRQTFQHN